MNLDYFKAKFETLVYSIEILITSPFYFTPIKIVEVERVSMKLDLFSPET